MQNSNQILSGLCHSEYNNSYWKDSISYSFQGYSTVTYLACPFEVSDIHFLDRFESCYKISNFSFYFDLKESPIFEIVYFLVCEKFVIIAIFICVLGFQLLVVSFRFNFKILEVSTKNSFCSPTIYRRKLQILCF